MGEFASFSFRAFRCVVKLLVCALSNFFLEALRAMSFPLILRNIKEKSLLLPVIFVVRVGILFMWLSSLGLLKNYFLAFSRA